MSKGRKEKPKRKLKDYEIDVDVIDLCLYAEKYFEGVNPHSEPTIYIEFFPEIDLEELIFDANSSNESFKEFIDAFPIDLDPDVWCDIVDANDDDDNNGGGKNGQK